MLIKVIIQGRIERYMYMSIDQIDISALQRRQRSLTLQVLIVNMSLFDIEVRGVTGNSTFEILNQYTLPTISSNRILPIPANSRRIYEIVLDGIDEDNANLILKCVKTEAILWRFQTEWQVYIPASFRGIRVIPYILEREEVPLTITISDLQNI